MTITVQIDGTVEDANSYVTVDELTTYASARGITIPTGDREMYLTLAMDYFESLVFKGVKTYDEQSTQFPRKYLYIDDVLVADDEIHKLVKESQMEAAIANYQGNGPLLVVERAVKRERVYGAVEVEYMDGASNTSQLRALSSKLQKLLNNSSTIFFRVDRV